VYADLDFEALQNHETLLDGRHVVLAAMEDESAADQQAVPNAWMASTRHHPFWLFAVAQVIKAASAPEERRARRPAAAALPDARPCARAPSEARRRGGQVGRHRGDDRPHLAVQGCVSVPRGRRPGGLNFEPQPDLPGELARDGDGPAGRGERRAQRVQPRARQLRRGGLQGPVPQRVRADLLDGVLEAARLREVAGGRAFRALGCECFVPAPSRMQ
jgi:hypothetical protein